MGAVSDLLESVTDTASKGIEKAIPYAGPIVGALGGGPIGAALGSGFSTLAGGGDLTDVAKNAGATYIGGSILPGAGGEAGAVAADSGQFGIDPGSFNPGVGGYTGSAIGAGTGFPYGGGETGTPAVGGGGGGAIEPFGVANFSGTPAAGSGGAAIEPFGATATPTPAGDLGASALPVGGTGGTGDGGLAQAGDEARKRAAATPAPAGAAKPGIFDTLINGVKKNPLASVGLGANIVSQIAASRRGDATANALKKLGQPASDISSSLLDQYRSGTINPSSQFDINKWKAEQIAKLKDYHARSGTANSSAALKGVANIEAQATAMADMARQGILAAGLSSAGVANGPLQAAIIAQAQADSGLTEAASKTLNSLMTLQGMTADQKKALQK